MVDLLDGRAAAHRVDGHPARRYRPEDTDRRQDGRAAAAAADTEAADHLDGSRVVEDGNLAVVVETVGGKSTKHQRITPSCFFQKKRRYENALNQVS